MSSRLIVNSIRHTGASSDAITFDNTGKCAFPNNTGNILQVVQAVKTDTASTTSATFADISGLSVSITPASTSNKILVTCNVYAGGDDNTFTGFKVFRDSTAIGLGTAGTGNQSNVSFSSFSTNTSSSAFGLRNASFEFLDSPSSTSSLTYKIQFASLFNNDDVYINRSQQQNDQAIYMFPISTITVKEIAA
jgi:hypothetical protein